MSLGNSISLVCDRVCIVFKLEPLAETHETTLPAPYIVEWRELQHIMW